MKYLLYVIQNMNCILTMIRLKTCVQNTLISVLERIRFIQYSLLIWNFQSINFSIFFRTIIQIWILVFFIINTTSPRLIRLFKIISTISFVNYFDKFLRISGPPPGQASPRTCNPFKNYKIYLWVHDEHCSTGKVLVHTNNTDYQILKSEH